VGDPKRSSTRGTGSRAERYRVTGASSIPGTGCASGLRAARHRATGSKILGHLGFFSRSGLPRRLPPGDIDSINIVMGRDRFSWPTAARDSPSQTAYSKSDLSRGCGTLRLCGKEGRERFRPAPSPVRFSGRLRLMGRFVTRLDSEGRRSLQWAPVALVGNITDDPGLRYTQSGAALAGFTVAVSPI
jgi:hypothetical protein